MKETKELTTKITIPTIDLPMIDPSFPKEALTENDQEYILQTSKLLVRVPKGGNAQNTIIFENGDRKATFVFYTSTTMQVSAIEDNDQALLFTNILGNDELLLEVKGKDVSLAFKIKEGFKNTGYPIQLNLEHLIVVKDYTNNLIVLKDERTREEVFTFEYPFIKDASNHMCNQIEMTVSQKEGQYFLGLVLPTTWMKREEQSYPFTLETRFNANEAMDDTVVTMTVNENGSASYQSDGKCTLGYTSDQIHRVVIFVNSLRIVQNIVQNQLDNYRVNLLLTYEEGERYQNSTGFVLYHKDGVVLRSLMQDEDHKLKVDITSYIKQEVKKYQQNQEVSTLQFTFFHDFDFLGSIDDHHFTGTDYIRIHNGAANSSFQRPYVEIKESNQYEELRSYSMLEGGTTSISLNTREVNHDIDLGEIKEGSLRIPITLRYQDSYRKRQELKNLPTHLGKGWHFNIEQRLEKERVRSSRTNGTKIVYYDGENKAHEFVEKWYFKEGSIKKYVSKNEVFFSMDGSLSYQDKEGKIHKVFYEAESEEGLTYLSKSSIYSYPQKNALKLKEHYYIRLSDGNLFEVYKSESGQLLIPVAKKELKKLQTNRSKFSKELQFIISDHNYEPDVTGFYDTIMPDALRYENGDFVSETEEIKEIVYKEFPLLMRNDKYSIPKLKRINIFYTSRKNEETGQIDRWDEYDEYENEMEIIYQPTYEFQNLLSEEELMDESVSEINEQLKEYEERILAYKEQVELLSSSLVERKKAAEYYRIVYYLSFKESYLEPPIEIKSEPQLGAELCKTRVEEFQENYNQALKVLTDYEQTLSQLKYQYQMLKERKEALLKEEKDEVRDIIVDQSNNILGFDKEGHLILIQSAKEEKLVLEYEGDDLLSIHGEQEKIRFLYNNSSHKISKIRDTLGRLTRLYYLNNDLSHVTFRKERNLLHSIDFSYSNDLLISIKDNAGIIHALSYSLTDVIITKKTSTQVISEVGLNKYENPQIVLQEKIERTDYQSPCIVTNLLTNQSITYLFDEKGRVTRMSSASSLKEKEVRLFHYDEKDRLRFKVNYKANQLFKCIIHANTDFATDKVFTYRINNTSSADLKSTDLPTFGTFFFAFTFKHILSGIISTFAIRVTDKDGNIRECQETFDDISEYMGVPFGLRNTDTQIQIIFHFSKTIDFYWLNDLEIFLANAVVYEYDEKDHLIKEISGFDEIHYEEWLNGIAKKITTIDSYGTISNVRYTTNHRDQITHQVDENGNEVSYFYDEEGRVIEERSYHSSAPLEARVKRYVYDENGYRQLISNGRTVNQKEVYQETENFASTGLLRYIRSPRGVKTNYGYDFHTGELTQMGVDDQGEINSTILKYRYGLLTSLSHHGTEIRYEYDAKGRRTSISVANEKLIQNDYQDIVLLPNPMNQEETMITSKVTSTKKDGHEVVATFDEEGKIIQVKNDDTETIDYIYNENGTLREIAKTGETISFDYFKKTEKVKSQIISTPTYTCSFEDSLDEKGRIATHSISMGSISSLHTYAYNTKHQITIDIGSYTGLKNSSSLERRELFVYDTLGRIKETRLTDGGKNVCNNQYKYLQNDDCTFDLVTSHKVIIPNKGTVETQYTYDEENQISTIQKGNQKTRYQYDGLNRLIREDNEELNQTITYQYDEGGNLKFVRKYTYTLSEELSNPLEEKKFTYSSKWKDQLVRVDNEVITYDTMGRMNKIGNDVLTWNGKGQLTSYKDTSFTYDVRNLRRTKGNLTYYYDGNGHILGEKGTKSINGVNQEIEIIYTYNMDKITGFVYNGVGYFYLRNIQGDILSIYKSEDLSLVASYQYDAWGNHTVTNYGEEDIGNINPIRYRGYYYDEETGLYYLNSRYYDPRLRRFISPDTLSILDETMSEINGLNLYMYCKDNPVMYVDPSGNMPRWAKWLIGGMVILGLAVGAFFGGHILGVIFGAAFYGAVSNAVGGAIVGGIIGCITDGLSGFIDGTTNGFMWGAISGGVIGALTSGINIAFGGLKIIGSAQKTGNAFHRFLSNVHAGKFAMQIGRYSEIGLNSKLKTVGLTGGSRPDVVAIARVGNNKLIEVVSKTQTILSQEKKIGMMIANNPGTTGKVISWIFQNWFYF